MTQTPAERIKEAFRSGTAPQAVRSAAARGVLPLSPEDLIELQVLLLADEDDATRSAAAAALAQISTEIVLALVENRATGAETLTYLATRSADWPDGLAPLSRRRDIPREAALALAASSASEALESLARNQEAIGRDPELGAKLLQNEALPRASRNRLLDYIDELEKIRDRQRHEAAGTGDHPETGLAPAKDPFLAALGVDAEVEAMLPELGLDIEHLAEASELLGEGDDDGLFQKLSRLNVGQKLRLAMFGTREERTILVRDSNRIVASAVIKNPKFTEQEADAVSRSRNVNDEVLRLIGTHRGFSKTYQIQHNLVCNPRCPVQLSVKYVPRLHDRDLRLIMKSRNVSEGVRRQARRVIETREARRRVRVGKR